MKVLHILNELKHSGAEAMLNAAYGRFAGRGIEAHVLSSGERIGDYGEVLARSGYMVHHVPFRRNPLFFREIYALLRRERFDVVHIHTERAFFWYTLVARSARVPRIIRTIHNVFDYPFYLHHKRRLQRALARRALKSVHTAIGESVLQFEKERFGNECVLVPNWIDADRFRPPSERQRIDAKRAYGVEPEDFALVTVGACDERKNHIALYSALEAANKALEDRKIIVMHVGEGTMLDEERAYLRERGIERYCIFVGTTNDVRPCLHAADAFVMTSLWEGLSIAALEAMSTGLPAILYDVRGLAELLEDGRGGVLVEPREEALVEALVAMEENRAWAREQGREARHKVLRSYAVESSVDKLMLLYAAHQAPRRRPATSH